MCALAATTFWFLNALNKDYSTRISYPIQFEYNDSIYVAVNPPPKKVTLNVYGYGWNLLRKSIQLGVEPLVYNLSNPARTKYITGNKLFPLISEQLQDVRINYVVDDTLFLDFDRRSTKKVALKIDSSRISLSNNYRIVSPVSIEPDTIVYSGPASLLKALPEFIYLELPAKNIDEDFEDEITVNYVQSSLIQTNHNKAKVNFDVAEYAREVKRTPVKLLNLPVQDSKNKEKGKDQDEQKKEYELLDKVVEVMYWVRKENAGRAKPEDFRIIADFESFNKKDSTVKITVEQKPDFISNVALNKTSTKVLYVPEE